MGEIAEILCYKESSVADEAGVQDAFVDASSVVEVWRCFAGHQRQSDRGGNVCV